MPALSVIFEEMTGPRRLIQLKGRSLPFQGVTWGTKQRVDINYFPGNPVAITQVIGPTWKPTTLTGRWSDVFLFLEENAPRLIGFPPLASPAQPGSDQVAGQTFDSGGAVTGQSARTARAARDAFYELCRGGQVLRFEWGSIVRFGYIVDFDPTHDREQDIDWSMTMEWIGDTFAQPKPAPQSQDTVSLLKRMIDNVEAVIDFLNEQAIFLEQYERLFNQTLIKLGSLTEELFGALARLTRITTRADPRVLFGTLKGILAGIQAAGVDLLNAFTTLGAAVGLSKTGDASLVAFANGLQAEFRKLALKLSADARIGQAEIEKFDSPAIQSIVTPSVGTTLRDISQQEYDTPNNWRAIMEFNGFATSVVPQGTIVRVPRI